MKRLCITVLIGACSLTACKTTFVASDTEPAKVSTTTTLPTGTPADLLPRLLTEVTNLSTAIGTGTDKGHEMTLVENLYTAVRPGIAAVDGVAALSFDAAIQICHDGEQFNRPADADKCLRNLQLLTTNFLAKHPA